MLLIIAYSLSWLFQHYFVSLGLMGELVGFGIGLVYFGYFNSHLASGQTIGKRILRIRVVDSEYATLSVSKSLVRFCVFVIPLFINTYWFMHLDFGTWSYAVVTFLILGIFLSTLYLCLFNWGTKQVFHDLLVGTYVVKAFENKRELGQLSSVHLWVIVAIFIGSALFHALQKNWLPMEQFTQMQEASLMLQSELDVKPRRLVIGLNKDYSDKQVSETSYLGIYIKQEEKALNSSVLARKIAIKLVNNYPELADKDSIDVHFIEGFDIFLLSMYSKHTYSFKPSELI